MCGVLSRHVPGHLPDRSRKRQTRDGIRLAPRVSYFFNHLMVSETLAVGRNTDIGDF